MEDDAADVTVVASDADLPAQSLSFAVSSQGAKGVATVVNASTGEFRYTPNIGRIGSDTFAVTATDGTATSLPVTVTVEIRARLDTGDIVTVSGSDDMAVPAVIAIAPGFGDQAIIASGAPLDDPRGVVADSQGNVFVVDGGANALLRIDSASGSITSLAGLTGFPIGVNLDRQGRVLVALGPAGISVRDAGNGSEMVLTPAQICSLQVTLRWVSMAPSM